MGCLSVSANVVYQGVSCKAYLVNEDLNVSASRCGSGLKVSVHQVCSLNQSAYLNAIPDTLWLTPDMLASAEFDIISNVNWTIN